MVNLGLYTVFGAGALLADVETIRALILMHHHPREAVLRVLGTELLWGLRLNILMSLWLDHAFITRASEPEHVSFLSSLDLLWSLD